MGQQWRLHLGMVLVLLPGIVLFAINLRKGADESLWLAVALLALCIPVLVIPDRWQARALLLVLSVEFALGAAEVGVRVLVKQTPLRSFGGSSSLLEYTADLNLPFRYRPGKPCSPPLTANREGWCDADYARAKPPGTLRIGVLGDSTSVTCESGDQLWHVVLENSLAERLQGSVKVEVIAAVVVGYNLPQHRENARTLLNRYEVDLLLYAGCLNDDQAYRFVFPPARVYLARLFHFHFIQVAVLNASNEFGSSPFFRTGLIGNPHSEIASQIEAMATERAVPFVCFMMPYLDEGRYWAEGPLHELLRQMPNYLDVSGLVPTERLHEYRIQPEDLFHPNAAFHALLAAAVEKHLLGTEPLRSRVPSFGLAP